ncbi:phospholipase D-like domain-containing protein [Pseudomonas sp. S2_H01]
MSEFKRFWKVYSHWFLLVVFFVAFIVLSVSHFTISPTIHPRLSSFVGGLAAAFLVATLQFVIQLHEQIKLSKFRYHGVLDFLEERSGKDVYKSIIKTAKKGTKIQLQGVTGNRFLQDFADFNDDKSRALIEALDRGVTVQILVAHSGFLELDNKPDLLNKTVKLASGLNAKYPNSFEIKYYKDYPSHNILACGDVCIVGPVFKGKSSKNSPAIIFDRSGSYVSAYLENFNHMWNLAGSDYE